MQKQAQPPFHAVSAESEQGTEIPSRRNNTNVHFDMMDGFARVLLDRVQRGMGDDGRGKRKPPSLLIYNGLIQRVWRPLTSREGL